MFLKLALINFVWLAATLGMEPPDLPDLNEKMSKNPDSQEVSLIYEDHGWGLKVQGGMDLDVLGTLSAEYLTHLSLQSINIPHLDFQSICQIMPHLIEFEANNCNIHSITWPISSNLFSLDLSKNKIQAIDLSDLGRMPLLQNAELSENKITNIILSDQITQQLALVSLNFSLNRIKTLLPNIFNVFPYMNNIDLSHNSIESIDEHSPLYVPKYGSEINLAYNIISSVDAKAVQIIESPSKRKKTCVNFTGNRLSLAHCCALIQAAKSNVELKGLDAQIEK